MPAELCHSDELLSVCDGDEESRLITELDRWARSGPHLSKTALDISHQLNSRRRRVVFWEHLADITIRERNNLLKEILASAHREEREGLRLLFTFLCGRPTTFLFPEKIASLRHTRRLARRYLFEDPPDQKYELSWLMDLQEILPNLNRPGQLAVALSEYGRRLEQILCLEDPMPFPFEAEVERLIRLEGEAASLRGHRLVDAAGGYDPVAMAKLLPLVVALDEWQGDLLALADRGPASLKHPLEQAMGAEETKRWRKSLAEEEGIAAEILGSWLSWMDETELVGFEPAAWVSLLRTLDEARYRRNIYAALILPRRWQDGRLGVKRRPPAKLFPPRAISSDKDYIWIDLSRVLWAQWISADGLPICPDVWEEETSPLLLLRSRIMDDAFCEMILENDGWIQRHGVVETIARGSRSLKILLRIAGSRKLYTGNANRDVPLALLENPTAIPISALRPFFNLRYITRHDMLRIARGRTDIREEISREARAFLNR